MEDAGFQMPDKYVSGELEEHVDRILTLQHEAIEMLAAAFVKQVGSREALKYELVQEVVEPEMTGSSHIIRYRWYFRKMED